MNPAAVAAFARLGELELYYETQGTGPPPGTTHTSLCGSAGRVVPMITEFLDDAGG